ncbi:MAG TPA: hypothetical protein VHA07_14265 [Devosia sp.]|nr:hypothetical protein [Devosia sp.]
MSAAALPVGNSWAALTPNNPAGRTVRSPERARPQEFLASFDGKTLFYDCFWDAEGRRVLLVGPPPYGLDYRAAVFKARPSRERLRARFFASLSTMVTELTGAPRETKAIEVAIAGESFVLPVQPNAGAELAGRRLLFSINRDNDLQWIREWAEYHVRAHGTDAVILFDNGSTRYSVADVHGVLADIPGLAHVGVPDWPYRFGPFDPALKANPYWGRFLQISSMSVVLRRYGERAYGLLDCDIDELAGTRSGASIYDLAHRSHGGLVVFRGTWIEATGQGKRHRDFTQRLADPVRARSAQRKWCLDPSRTWVRRLSVHPYWHWIEGRAWFSKSMPEDAHYWHFKGINTNWKQARNRAPEDPTVRDEVLALVMRRSGLVS